MKTFNTDIRRLQILIAFGFALVGSGAHADELAMSGRELFTQHCAVCHGTSAHGDGPVSKLIKVPVPDLTLVTQRHGGQFPTELVEKIIDGRYVIGAHGTREMPIWGEEFMRKEVGNPDADRATALMVKRLAEYVRSIQQPSTGGVRK